MPYPVHLNSLPLSNAIVFIVLAILVIATLRKNTQKQWLIPLDDTAELKGFAMIAVVFVHIGYTLVNNWQFLYPVSTLAGVWVDLFLFLSGYGLTISMYKKPLTVINFYRGRLFKILIPFWIALIAIVLMDFFILGIGRSWTEIITSLFVWFPRAYMWEDINSPLWYMMWLILFYILFPIVFVRSRPWITSLILALIASGLVWYNPLDLQATWLHELHTLAFPLGVLVAGIVSSGSGFVTKYEKWRTEYNQKPISIIVLIALVAIGYGLWKIDANMIGEILWLKSRFPYIGVVIEQIRSLLLMFTILFFFSWKPWKSGFLWLFWVLSYEIYLLHWPLMARYDIFFHHHPAWLATLVWLGVLMVIGWGMQNMIKRLHL